MNTYCGFISTVDCKRNDAEDGSSGFAGQDVIETVQAAFANSATQITITRYNGSIGIAFFNFSNHDGGVIGVIKSLFEALSASSQNTFGFASIYDDERGVGQEHTELSFNYPPRDL